MAVSAAAPRLWPLMPFPPRETEGPRETSVSLSGAGSKQAEPGPPCHAGKQEHRPGHPPGVPTLVVFWPE